MFASQFVPGSIILVMILAGDGKTCAEKSYKLLYPPCMVTYCDSGHGVSMLNVFRLKVGSSCLAIQVCFMCCLASHINTHKIILSGMCFDQYVHDLFLSGLFLFITLENLEHQMWKHIATPLKMGYLFVDLWW